MVPVMSAVKVDVVSDVSNMVVCIVPEPEASANRPVPPIMLKETISWNIVGFEPGHETPEPAMETWSPFAAVSVSTSIPTNPPQSD